MYNTHQFLWCVWIVLHWPTPGFQRDITEHRILWEVYTLRSPQQEQAHCNSPPSISQLIPHCRSRPTLTFTEFPVYQRRPTHCVSQQLPCKSRKQTDQLSYLAASITTWKIKVKFCTHLTWSHGRPHLGTSIPNYWHTQVPLHLGILLAPGNLLGPYVSALTMWSMCKRDHTNL